MSDTFAFRAIPVPLYRRVSLRAVKVTLLCVVVVAGVGAFGRWTIRSEHESFAAAARHAPGPQALVDISYTDAGVPTGMAEVSAADRFAQTAARKALARARRLAGRPLDLPAAGPGQLAGTVKGVTFTDGPSLSPAILSVAGTATSWGAAVMSTSGLCFAVRLGGDGTARFGTLQTACTGEAALQVTGDSW